MIDSLILISNKHAQVGKDGNNNDIEDGKTFLQHDIRHFSIWDS